MSSTDQSTTSESKLSGYKIGIPGAVLAIVCFFLPWIAFVVEGMPFASLTGSQIASGITINTNEGVKLLHGSMLNYLVPLVGIVVLVQAFFAYRRGYVSRWDGLGTIGLGVVALLIVWGQFSETSRVAEREGIALQFQYGIIGVYLALAASIVAGVLNVRAATKRDPSFGATLGAWGFMSPATFLVVVFFFVPAIILFILSMTDLSSSNFSEPWHFIGFENFRRMFSDTFFPKIMGNTFKYVILTLGFFNVGLALVLALLTSNIDRRAGFFFRVIWLLPRITPSVVYIVMWRRFTQLPPYGIINWFLGMAGVEHQPYWLNEMPWLFVILVNGFVGASFGMIIFTSAIEAIPKDYITAAKVDGASTWNVIRDIILPLLRWPLLFVTSYQTLSLLVSFEYILLLTQGGPGLFTTEVWALTSYKRALFTYFGTNQWGQGAAWGLILVIIAITASIIYLRVFRFNELVQEPKIDVL
jgi:inositol-phosphate transport system permease protein